MPWFYAEVQATVLLYDGFAVLDRERHDVDSKLGDNDSDWHDVSGDRVGKRHALPLVARFTKTSGTIRLVFAIGSTPSFDDGALSSFHGSRRVTQFLQWAAPLPAGARHSGRTVRAAPRRVECGRQRAGD